MSEQDPNELLIICDSIIEDGELTFQELYQLAEWINGHPEACAHWPGSLLVEPLQIAWADGKISIKEYAIACRTDNSLPGAVLADFASLGGAWCCFRLRLRLNGG